MEFQRTAISFPDACVEFPATSKPRVMRGLSLYPTVFPNKMRKEAVRRKVFSRSVAKCPKGEASHHYKGRKEGMKLKAYGGARDTLDKYNFILRTPYIGAACAKSKSRRVFGFFFGLFLLENESGAK